MFGTTCPVEGCDKPAAVAIMDPRCRYHSAMESARWLSASEFDRLRNELATTAPITTDERNKSLARSALRSIEWQACDLKKSKARARKAGATEGQIAEAVKRGKGQVK